MAPLENLEEPVPDSWFFKFREYMFSKDFKKKKGVVDDDVQSMLFAFLNRTRFKYHANMIFAYFCRCFCLRNLYKNRRDDQYKTHYLFSKAEKKFRGELDVVRIVKTLRRYKMFS